MSKRGKELAAEAARRMLESSGLTKAYGTFDQVAEACRDDGETLATIEKMAASVLAEKEQVAREKLRMAAHLDQLAAMTQQVGIYLDRIEKFHQMAPATPVWRSDRVLSDFVIGSRPVSKPEANGHERHM